MTYPKCLKAPRSWSLRFAAIVSVAIALSAMGAAGLEGSAVAQQSGEATPVQTVAEQFLLAAANGDRIAHGLDAVRVDSALVRAAAFHARQMAAHGTISHQFPGEPELAERAASAGARLSLVTENVAQASNPGIIHDLWMKSAGHRANLLDPQVDAVGISVISRNGQFYAVEDFARSVRSLSFAQQEQTVSQLIESMGVRVAPTSDDARRTCSLSTGYGGQRPPSFVLRYTAADLSRLPQQLQTRLISGRYHEAMIGACATGNTTPFSVYAIAVLLYP
jgi:uncharacterized protein YkwD